jgi:hypothetical protein
VKHDIKEMLKYMGVYMWTYPPAHNEQADQGSSWDGIIPSHPIPWMGRFLKNFSPMGWDGMENFRSHPIPWDIKFLKDVPSHDGMHSLKKKFL